MVAKTCLCFKSSLSKTTTHECRQSHGFLPSAFPTHRRWGKQERQSQALMEHLRLTLCMIIGQACKTAAAFQGMSLVSGLPPLALFRGALTFHYILC